MLIADASIADAPAIADLHATSWRVSYRGIMPDAFLDGPVIAERLHQWDLRFRTPAAGQIVLKAADDDGAVCGFACAFLDADDEWGALLDNLHVAPGRTGHGIGQQLLDATFVRIAQARPHGRTHLWVVDTNIGARRFYERNGGHRVDDRILEILPGLPVSCVRYGWSTAS